MDSIGNEKPEKAEVNKKQEVKAPLPPKNNGNLKEEVDNHQMRFQSSPASETKIVPDNNSTSEDKADFEKIKLIYEFQYETIKEASGVLEKGISFFLIIIAALTSYVISTKEDKAVDLDLQLKLVLGAIITTVFVTICVSSIAWGLYKGLLDLKKTLKFATTPVWGKTNIEKYITRGTATTLIIGIAGSSLMVVILVFYINIYNQKSSALNLIRSKSKSENSTPASKPNNSDSLKSAIPAAKVDSGKLSI